MGAMWHQGVFQGEEMSSALSWWDVTDQEKQEEKREKKEEEEADAEMGREMELLKKEEDKIIEEIISPEIHLKMDS